MIFWICEDLFLFTMARGGGRKLTKTNLFLCEQQLETQKTLMTVTVTQEPSREAAG